MALAETDRITDDGSVERFCVGCKKWQPKEDSYAKNGNGFRELCKVCYRIRQNEKRTLLTKAAMGKLVKQLVSGKATTHIDVPHTSEMASGIVKSLGGLDGFVELYTNAMKAAYTENPTSKVTLEYMKLTAGIVTKSTDQRESAPDVAQMNEDELNTELSAMIGKLLEDNPDLLTQIADAKLIEVESVDGDG